MIVFHFSHFHAMLEYCIRDISKFASYSTDLSKSTISEGLQQTKVEAKQSQKVVKHVFILRVTIDSCRHSGTVVKKDDSRKLHLKQFGIAIFSDG